MPAAAVIPAPRVYIKVVAVKKLVVGLWGRTFGLLLALPSGLKPGVPTSFLESGKVGLRVGCFIGFTLNKLGCLKQA